MRKSAYDGSSNSSADGTRFLRLLADETRLRILALLLRTPNLCVCELVAVFRLPQYRISRHLGQLRRSGLLTSQREGPFVFYSIAEGVQRHPVHGAILRALPRLAGRDVASIDLGRLRRLMKLEIGQRRSTSAAPGPPLIMRGRPILRVLGKG